MDEKQKKVMLTVRMTEEEHERLKAFCWWERLTISEFIRSLIPDQPIPGKKGSE